MTKLKNVIDKLLQKQELEPKYKDHALMGNWNGYRDCHLEPDWLLIYKITDSHLFFSALWFPCGFILIFGQSFIAVFLRMRHGQGA